MGASRSTPAKRTVLHGDDLDLEIPAEERVAEGKVLRRSHNERKRAQMATPRFIHVAMSSQMLKRRLIKQTSEWIASHPSKIPVIIQDADSLAQVVYEEYVDEFDRDGSSLQDRANIFKQGMELQIKRILKDNPLADIVLFGLTVYPMVEGEFDTQYKQNFTAVLASSTHRVLRFFVAEDKEILLEDKLAEIQEKVTKFKSQLKEGKQTLESFSQEQVVARADWELAEYTIPNEVASGFIEYTQTNEHDVFLSIKNELGRSSNVASVPPALTIRV